MLDEVDRRCAGCWVTAATVAGLIYNDSGTHFSLQYLVKRMAVSYGCKQISNFDQISSNDTIVAS